MTLIKSISGMRGTLGGKPGECLSPVDVMRFTGAYGMWLKQQYPGGDICIVIGRDARTSGDMVSKVVTATLQGMGIHIIDGGITTTPTVAMGVLFHQAQGGIVITASHNPRNWNALKFLDHMGEFLREHLVTGLESFMSMDDFEFMPVDKLGTYTYDEGMLEMHLEEILALPLVDAAAVRKAGFRVVVDGVSSSGGIAVPRLLEKLGVVEITRLYCDPTGAFQHNPEPLPENLAELAQLVYSRGADLGFAVDPDVDRLSIVDENGDFFGEEYTIVAVADYILMNTPGNTVSNMSSTMALKDITLKYGQQYFSSAVGEANVVEAMKNHHAVIGGEGNGGVIYPPLHYGRDALVGIALFLTHLAGAAVSCSVLKKRYPQYYLTKKKIELPADVNMQEIMDKVLVKYESYPHETVDGIKLWFDSGWVHLRKSNTEPIIRIYAESDDEIKAGNLSMKIMRDIGDLMRGDQD